MATIELDGTIPGFGVGILDRERTIATAGFNRWLVPPAALCIHLCIGMAYGFSVFWLPLSRSIGITKTMACPDMTLAQELFMTRQGSLPRCAGAVASSSVLSAFTCISFG